MPRAALGLLSLLLLVAAPAPAYDGPVQRRVIRVPSFATTSGQVVPLELGVETYGQLNGPRDNAVLVSHFIAGDGHAAGRRDPGDAPGWWDGLIGRGAAIDTDRLCVVSIDLPCSMRVKDPRVVTTGPSTIDPRTGRRFGPTFPALDIRDLVHAQKAVLDALGVRHLRAVVGPSMGGMLALAWAIELPTFVDVAIPVGAPLAFTASERGGMRSAAAAIRGDPLWCLGDYAAWGVEPTYGVALALGGLGAMARGEGLLWFSRLPQVLAEAREYDANHYLWLIELHAAYDLGRAAGSLEAALRRIRARVVLVGSQDDDFITPARLRSARDALVRAGVPTRLALFQGAHGHLSVLEDQPALAPVLAQELARVAP